MPGTDRIYAAPATPVAASMAATQQLDAQHFDESTVSAGDAGAPASDDASPSPGPSASPDSDQSPSTPAAAPSDEGASPGSGGSGQGGSSDAGSSGSSREGSDGDTGAVGTAGRRLLQAAVAGAPPLQGTQVPTLALLCTPGQICHDNALCKLCQALNDQERQFLIEYEFVQFTASFLR